MASVDKELEQQLLEAGNRLSLLPTQVDELLPLLDQVNNLLSKVEQSPPKPIQNAYSPSMIALLEEPLLKHSDVDVKVAIASCISEITRITAPEAPYNDDQMKDVFQLIVSSFENLSDKSSRSYNKRASILETVAKVRSCVVMLDLECDGLIVEMFQHFLNSIRDYHPDNVFTSMETIMTLVLEESEDVSLELLTTILASVKRDNEEIPTIARKLGEKVFEKCAVKIKPYLAQAVKSLGVSLDDYGKVVTSICEGTTGAVEHNDANGNGEQLAAESKLTFSEEAAQVDDRKLNTASSNDTARVAKEDVTEEASLKEVCAEAKTSLKSVASNGMTEIGNEGTSFVPESSEKPDEGNFSSESLDVNLTNKVDTDDSDAGKFAKSESKPEQTVKRRGRKPNSVLNSTETSDSSHLDSDKEAEITCQQTSDKEAEKPSQPQKSDSKDSHTSCGEDQHVDTGASSEKKREHERQISSPKALNNVVNVAYLFPSEIVPDESVPKKAAWGKKKENLAQEDAPSVDPVPAKVTDETSDLEVKPPRHSEKTKENLAQEDAPSVVPVSVKVADGEVKPQRRSGKKKGNLAQEDAPSVDPVSVEVVGGTIDLEVKPQRSSGKKKKNLAQEDAPSVDPVLAKVADETSDSEVKPQRRSGKKATARITKEEKMVTGGGTSKSEGETTSDSVAKPLRESAKKGDASDLEAKPLKQSGKKGETSRPRARGKSLKQSGKKGHDSDSEIKPLGKEDPSNYEDKASSKKNDKKSRGRGKDNREKDLSKSHAKDDDQDMVSSPKLVKDEERLEEPKTNLKRKRIPGKDVLLSSFDKVSGNMEYEGNLVGSKVKVWWPKDRAFYEGVIHSFYPDTKKHKVLYTDGDEEILVLQKEKWEYVKDETEQEEANEEESSSKTKHKEKTAKTNSEPLPKQKQMDVSPKRGGAAAASSKSKGTPTKSVSKVDDRKVDSKSKDKTSKPTDKSTDNLRCDGKSVDDVLRAAIKSKDGGSMPKISAKSNQETPKAVTKTKGKTPQSGNKSNGTGKVKSSSSKVKEADNTKGKSSDSGKTPDTVKGKSPEISKVQESEAKSGKKRRRGFKG